MRCKCEISGLSRGLVWKEEEKMGKRRGHSTSIPAFEQNKTTWDAQLWEGLKRLLLPIRHQLPQTTLFWPFVWGSRTASWLGVVIWLPRALGLLCPPGMGSISERQHPHQGGWSRGCKSSLINKGGRARFVPRSPWVFAHWRCGGVAK